jgi:hypothetical protein
METDLTYGLTKEVEVLNILQNFFELPLKKTSGRFDIFDFEADNTLVELKSRRCNSWTYPDTMIGYNKIQYAYDNPDKNIIYCFNFQDGLYYHRFNPEINYKPKIAGRCDRGRPEFKRHAFINRSFLYKMN